MIFYRWDRAIVAIAVGTPRIVAFIEVDGHFSILDITCFEVNVSAAAIGLFAIRMVFEREEKMISVAGHGNCS